LTKQAEGRALDPERVAEAFRCLTPERARPVLHRLQESVCDATRAQILAALRAGPLAVEDIGLVVGRATPATSQHLRVLREHGLVEPERRGRRIYYRLTDGQATQQAVRFLNEVEQIA
jgi:DNA-binding transcriptional ArsR family regulator